MPSAKWEREKQQRTRVEYEIETRREEWFGGKSGGDSADECRKNEGNGTTKTRRVCVYI